MAEINVTPLVDVMLVLLIIFMVSAPLLDLNQGVHVEIPQTKAAIVEPGKSEPIVITIDQKGTYFLLRDDKSKPLAGLIEFVKAARENDPHKEVFLRADHRVDYGKVVELMAELQNAGLESVGLVTQPPASKPVEKAEQKR